MNFKSVDDILDYAIQREIEAYEFYTELAGKLDNPAMRKLFEGFAGEEKGHKAKLESIKADKSLVPAQKEVLSLNMADYMVDVEVTPDISYQDALIVAMKKEKAAFRLYTDLAASTDNAAIRTIFKVLAQEEAKHKLRFEIEYDEFVLTDN
ncbi:ferritin family protein [bacterium]|nr:ferritin family protein [candidate division CSSED10-310 bacterium]